MADLEVEGSELVLHMHGLEKAESVHRDIRVPLSAVSAVRSVDDPSPSLRGIRAPGTGVPNVIAVGTRRGSFGKDFAAVHGKGPAVVVELEGCQFSTPRRDRRRRGRPGEADSGVAGRDLTVSCQSCVVSRQPRVAGS